MHSLITFINLTMFFDAGTGSSLHFFQNWRCFYSPVVEYPLQLILISTFELKCHVHIHTGAKTYSCRHCSDRFTRLAHLKRHLLKSHNEGTWLTCHICQKKFSDNGHLKTHLRRHEAVKPYVCSDCTKRFYTAGELKSHQLTHSEFRQFYCSLCDKCYKHKRDVKRHFKRRTEKLGPPLFCFKK